MRKYVCDNCGIEYDAEFDRDGHINLLPLRWSKFVMPIGEYCGVCRKKIEKRIKEGVN